MKQSKKTTSVKLVWHFVKGDSIILDSAIFFHASRVELWYTTENFCYETQAIAYVLWECPSQKLRLIFPTHMSTPDFISDTMHGIRLASEKLPQGYGDLDKATWVSLVCYQQ